MPSPGLPWPPLLHEHSILDVGLRRFATHAPKDIDTPILAALRIGIDGLPLRRYVPAPKIASEAVPLAGASKGACAFANAVLRKLAGGFTVEPAPRSRTWAASLLAIAT